MTTYVVTRPSIRYSWTDVENENGPSETITFLGTGGARFMIITQMLASGGLWLDIGGTEILVDPGPGCRFRPAGRVPDRFRYRTRGKWSVGKGCPRRQKRP